MLEVHLKLLFSAIAIALTFIAFIPYIYSIVVGKTKPHVFSWIIWGLTTVIVFFAQLQAGAGIGAWPIGVSGCITLLIAFLAFIKRGDISITKVDWLFFGSALASVPLWYFSSEPLWAVVVLTLVDLLGFGPTMRKAYDCPHQENRLFFTLFLVRNCFAILALEHFSLTTVLFPLSVNMVCCLLLAIISYRRYFTDK